MCVVRRSSSGKGWHGLDVCGVDAIERLETLGSELGVILRWAREVSRELGVVDARMLRGEVDAELARGLEDALELRRRTTGPRRGRELARRLYDDQVHRHAPPVKE
jgi:hypothetical protein